MEQHFSVCGREDTELIEAWLLDWSQYLDMDIKIKGLTLSRR